MEQIDLDDSRDSDQDEEACRGDDKAPLLSEDTNLTLSKKKSWFGSIREMGQKVALRAKATMESLRGGEDATDKNKNENEAPPTPKHKRNTSVANSVKGSLRSLSRIKWKGPESPTSKRQSMSEELPAEQVPLPSSPINIAPTAPTLHLDIGSDGFMSTTFISTTLSDPANITTGTPIQSRQLHIPPELEAKFVHDAAEVANSTSSKRSERSKIFERSVTPPNDPDRKTLRNMRSLNALAETYTIAQVDVSAKKDDAAETGRASDDEFSTPLTTPKSKVQTPYQDVVSGSTIRIPPPDMPKLTRQDQSPVNTPSPGIPVTLPLRLKRVTVEPAAALAPGEGYVKVVGEASPVTESSSLSSPWGLGASSESPHGTQVKLGLEDTLIPQLMSLEEAENFETAAANECTQAEAQNASTSAIACANETTAHDTVDDSILLQRIPEELMLCHYTPPGDILSYIGSLESGNLKSSLLQAQTTEDKDQTDPHEPIPSGVAQPSQANSEISTTEDCLPHEENVLPELYHYIPSKEYPIFGTSRSRTTYTTGLGDANYKFCLENWLKTTTPSASSGEERTSTRRQMSASIDSLSTNGDNKLPKVHQLPSDAEESTSANHSPSMGNRLEFDLKRSERNMRYNALHQVENIRHELCEEIDANALACVDIDKAYASSPVGPPMPAGDREAQEEVSPSDKPEDSASAAELELACISQHLAECINVLEGKGTISKGESAKSTQDLVEIVLRTRKAASESASVEASDSSDVGPENISVDKEHVHLEPHVTSEIVGSHIKATRRVIHLDINDPSSTIKSRAVSSDTLDKTLPLFSSPESGYEADKENSNPTSDSDTPLAMRKRKLAFDAGLRDT